jgi:hypothetical protein
VGLALRLLGFRVAVQVPQVHREDADGVRQRMPEAVGMIAVQLPVEGDGLLAGGQGVFAAVEVGQCARQVVQRRG